jgi:hypothetical protein
VQQGKEKKRNNKAGLWKQSGSVRKAHTRNENEIEENINQVVL